MPSAAQHTLIVGGGLAGCLCALALRRRQPDVAVTILERADTLGGNHLWSFHVDDVPEASRDMVAPLVIASWPSYDVSFPRLNRRLEHSYASISSERLHEHMQVCAHADELLTLATNSSVTEVGASHVLLAGGQRMEADLVLDGRGPGAYQSAVGTVGYQKFVGLEVELAHPSPRALPHIMDASVAQIDGYRFVYVLPFNPRKVLIEDTYYSDSPDLDVDAIRGRALLYANEHGYDVARIIREETGVLPLPTRAHAVSWNDDGPLPIGYAGGFFHPTTGYSLPVAVRLAELIAHTKRAALRPAFERFRREHQRQFRYFLMLNRLLFDATPPEQRWNVLERFYRRPESTVRRFYALTTTPADRARILCGRPPQGISLTKAIRGIAT